VRDYVLAQMNGQRQERQYPLSFRSLLDEQTASAASRAPPQEAKLRVECQCGQCRYVFSVTGKEGKPPVMYRCHCSSCRIFHVSSYGAYVFAAHDEPGRSDIFGAGVLKHREKCGELGDVERISCGSCYSKLATVPLEGPLATGIFVELGSVADEFVPTALALHWQQNCEEWRASERAAWWHAEEADRSRIGLTGSISVEGRCACGGCTFQAAVLPGQVQHCYCNLAAACQAVSLSLGCHVQTPDLDGYEKRRSSSCVRPDTVRGTFVRVVEEY